MPFTTTEEQAGGSVFTMEPTTAAVTIDVAVTAAAVATAPPTLW